MVTLVRWSVRDKMLIEKLTQGCHQIREFRENQRKNKDILKNQGESGTFSSYHVSFLSGDFLFTLSHIQSSVKIAKVSTIFIAFCSVRSFAVFMEPKV